MMVPNYYRKNSNQCDNIFLTSANYIGCVVAVHEGHHPVIEDKPDNSKFTSLNKIGTSQVTVTDDINSDATSLPSHYYLTTYSLLYCFMLGQELLIIYLTVHISTMKILLFLFQ